jgi:hypothetical protein
MTYANYLVSNGKLNTLFELLDQVFFKGQLKAMGYKAEWKPNMGNDDGLCVVADLRF